MKKHYSELQDNAGERILTAHGSALEVAGWLSNPIRLLIVGVGWVDENYLVKTGLMDSDGYVQVPEDISDRLPSVFYADIKTPEHVVWNSGTQTGKVLRKRLLVTGEGVRSIELYFEGEDDYLSLEEMRDIGIVDAFDRLTLRPPPTGKENTVLETVDINDVKEGDTLVSSYGDTMTVTAYRNHKVESSQGTFTLYKLWTEGFANVTVERVRSQRQGIHIDALNADYEIAIIDGKPELIEITT